MSDKVKCIVTLVFVVGIAVAILIGISFGYVDFYDFAFAKQKSTGKVFTDRSYSGGRYFIGPDFTFKTYPASGQAVHITDLNTFTSDSLIVSVDVFFVYFIRKNHLQQLHQEYQLNYHSVIINKAYDAIKQASGKYSTVQFIMNRTLVEKEMADYTRRRIGGKCCVDDEGFSFSEPGCIPMEKCTSYDDIGMMSDVRYFYLIKLDMPDKVEQRYLKEMILVQETQEEALKLQEAVERKETDELVKGIENRASEVSGEAEAKATFVTVEANANATQIVGRARSEGLKDVMTRVGFKQNEQISYFYLKTLSESSHANLAVDFNNYVIGGR